MTRAPAGVDHSTAPVVASTAATEPAATPTYRVCSPGPTTTGVVVTIGVAQSGQANTSAPEGPHVPAGWSETGAAPRRP